ncbi:MAG: HWE histidine kinase domain-containing protein [Geminicoccaceae bacterium]
MTEQKRTQNALATSEARLRGAARAAVFGIHEFDPSRQEATWSPEMGRILGIPADGPKSPQDVLTTVHPDDRDRVSAEMAAIQHRVGPYEIECRIMRPDGETRWIMDRGEAVGPLDPGTGRVFRITGTVIDITERKLVEERLRAAHDTFRHLVDRSPFGIYVVDADFRLVQVSDGAQKVFSNVRPLIGRDFAEVLRAIWPEPFASEAIGRFRHTLVTGEAFHAPTTVEQRADIGDTEAYDWKLERIALPDGRPGVVCHFYDLTERQRQEDHIKFLMREVNHRSQNLLALIQGIVRLTAPKDTDDFIERFGERLRSLGAAQTLLVNNVWRSVPLDDLVRSQLSHLSDRIDTRIAITGPAVSLSPAAAQALGLALHELATNAAKHGALSTDAGRVEVAWGTRIGADAAPLFVMSWTERDGPPVAPPRHLGFGTEVTTTMTRMSLGGEVTVDYAPGGFLWKVACPLGNIAEAR